MAWLRDGWHVMLKLDRSVSSAQRRRCRKILRTYWGSTSNFQPRSDWGWMVSLREILKSLWLNSPLMHPEYLKSHMVDIWSCICQTIHQIRPRGTNTRWWEPEWNCTRRLSFEAWMAFCSPLVLARGSENSTNIKRLIQKNGFLLRLTSLRVITTKYPKIT